MKIRNPFKRRNRKPEQHRVERGFAAALSNRLNEDWVLDHGYTPKETASQLPTMRGRSRDLAKNNPYMRKIISLNEDNVVGPHGIKLKSLPMDTNGTLDTDAAATIEANWIRWGSNPDWCDAAGRKTFRDHCRLAVAAIIRDGEHLIRILPGFDHPQNPYAFALKAYRPDALDVRLNTERVQNGNYIANGIEFNSWGRPVAYYFVKDDSNNQWMLDYPEATYGHTHERIPAAEIVHVFVEEQEGQGRGFPQAYTVLERLKRLDAYTKTELDAAYDEACTVGIYKKREGADNGEVASRKDLVGSLQERKPGAREVMPDGWELDRDGPHRPNSVYPDFTKGQLREAATGGLVSYPSLANDLEHVNYSSMRSGKQEERDHYMMLQTVITDQMCDKIFTAWLGMFLTTGMSSLPITKAEKYQKHTWRPRRWAWVDPLKDAQYNKILRAHGWKTDQQICNEIGTEFDKNIAEIKQAQPATKDTYLEPNYEDETENR